MIQNINKSYFLENTNNDEDYQKRCIRIKPNTSKKDDTFDNNKDSSRSASRHSINQETDEESTNEIF